MKEPDPQKDSLVGKTLDGKYLILEQLGSGGMGAVYKGRHVHLNRDCAIKVIRRHHAEDPVALKRFKLEAEAASLLKHPNVIEIHDFGIDNEQPYIVMELISGCSLDDLLAIQKYLHYELAIPIFIQVCDALAHAHEKKVLHRDLKPGNIMLLNDNEPGEQANSNSGLGQRVKLVDFGIAKLLPGTGKNIDKLTATGELFGSPLYMSPEQCMGQSLDSRSDIYALGCVMYETLTGKLPLVGDSMFQVVMKHINEMPPQFAELAPDIAIPEKLESLVFQCLAKERALRFATVKELRKALSQIYTSSQFSSQPPPAPESSQSRSPDLTTRLKPADPADFESTSHFLRSLADESGEAENLEASERILLAKLEQIEKSEGKRSRRLISVLGKLYRLYEENWLSEKAVAVKQRQADLFKDLLGPESIDLAEAYAELAYNLINLRRYAEAEPILRESLRIKVLVLGLEDLSTSWLRVNLARALSSQEKEEGKGREKDKEAEELIENALKKIAELSGESSLDMSNLYSQCADYYFDVERYGEAYLLYEKAVEIEKIRAYEDTTILRLNLSSMARCKHLLGEYQTAIEIANEVIELDEHNPCKDDVTREHPWSTLASCYYNLGETDKAEKACLKSIEIIESCQGGESFYIVSTLYLLADIYDKAGQTKKARACRQRAELLEDSD